MDLDIGRVRLTVISPGGASTAYGKLDVAVTDGRAVATRRRREVVADEVASVSVVRAKEYVLTMASGSTWTTQGCGCGGR